MDGDGLPNALDADPDADGKPGLAADLEASRPFAHVAVSTERGEASAWRSADVLALTFALDVKNVADRPVSVTVLAPDSQVEGAQVETRTEAAPWDRTLLNDGLNSDGAGGDGLFARRVVLAGDKRPRQGQVVFFRAVCGAGGDGAPTVDYPLVFSVDPAGTVTAQYDAVTGTVLLAGAPFGESLDFNWYVTLLDAAGRVLWISPATSGATRQQTIPASELPNAVHATTTAALPGRSPGFPTNATRSLPLEL